MVLLAKCRANKYSEWRGSYSERGLLFGVFLRGKSL